MPANAAEVAESMLRRARDKVVAKGMTESRWEEIAKVLRPELREDWARRIAALPWGGWLRASERDAWTSTRVVLEDGTPAMIASLDRGGIWAELDLEDGTRRRVHASKFKLARSSSLRWETLDVSADGQPVAQERATFAHGTFMIEPEGARHALYYFDLGAMPRFVERGDPEQLRQIAEERAARGEPAPAPLSRAEDQRLTRIFLERAEGQGAQP